MLRLIYRLIKNLMNKSQQVLIILAFTFLLTLTYSQPLMLEARKDFIQTLAKSTTAVFFYGTQDSEQYSAFENILPTDKQLFSDLQFYFIPSSSIKLSKKDKSLFLYRNIEGNQWLTYDGPFDVNLMSKWVRHNCFDSLPEVKGDEIDDMLVHGKNGFILLDMGQYELLATKILINDYCKEKKIICRKCTLNNQALRIVVQLMQADDQYGISKLAYWNAQTSRLEMFTKAPLHKIQWDHLVELHEGKKGLVRPETSPKVSQHLEAVQLDQDL